MYEETSYADGKIVMANGQEEYIRHMTGINALDKALEGGITNGITTIGGMAGYCKSMLAMQIAFYLCEQGKYVYVYSNEMKAFDYWQRLRNLERRVGVKSEEVCSRFKVLDISEEGEINNLISDIKEKHASTPDMVVVLDYLQRFSNQKSGGDNRLYMEECLRKLENVTYKLNFPMILLSTVNGVRSLQEKMKLSSFKESTEIAHASDIIIAIEQNRSSIGDGYEYELTVLKNKKGALPANSIKLICYPKDSYFTDGNKVCKDLPWTIDDDTEPLFEI